MDKAKPPARGPGPSQAYKDAIKANQQNHRIYEESEDLKRAQELAEEIAFTADNLIKSDSSRQELAMKYADASVTLNRVKEELAQSRWLFTMFVKASNKAMKAVTDVGDPVEAQELLSGGNDGNIFTFNKLIHLTHLASNSTAARRSAMARYAKGGPKSEAKAVVLDCWQRWSKCPKQYPSTAAFARSMMDKFPDDLKSQPVIERWVREWRRAKN